MSVRIRLRRVGRKKQPSYRLVVTQSQAPRGGAYLDTLGFYNPLRRPAELTVDLQKVDAWLARGAELTDTAASLVRKARKGGDRSVAIVERPVGGAQAAVPARRPAPVTPPPRAAEPPVLEEAARLAPEPPTEAEALAAPPAAETAPAPAAEAEIEAGAKKARKPSGKRASKKKAGEEAGE
ncbi:MAG: 30S ribosomal protein S16 [Gemmatimonadetes bacterium]|nr:30S ribosomal protein S16 [Gemmatimonadota bacterium]